MVTATLSEQAHSIKLPPSGSALAGNADRKLLLVLLERIVTLIEMIWREEVGAKAFKTDDTPRQAALRKAHQAIGEWFDLETLTRQGCL